MKRRDVLPLLGGAVAVWPLAARAQQRSIPLVGLLMGSSPANEAGKLAGFREGLERLGYVEGRTIRLEVRYAEGVPERYGSLARELVALAPALIACVGRVETAALQAATRTIPIVFLAAGDPVENGLVASLARPGGNTTGFAQHEIDAKLLELLKETMPAVSRASFLMNPIAFKSQLEAQFANAEAAAKILGITLQRVDATTPAELTAAFAQIETSSTEALMMQSEPMFGREILRIVDFAAARRLPIVSEINASRAPGVLIVYGADPVDLARRGASYVDRILKGAKPADLPVQLPIKFLLTINLSTAKALGLTIPHSILLRADEVIE